MTTTTDNLRLNATEMFAKLRAGLPELKATHNLLECKDDLLFAWDAQDSCLLVINWRAQLHGQANIKYQTLMPSVPQSFDVERVLASNEGSLIALAGTRGITVLELPRRWGKNGQFMEGKEKITCRATNLDAHFFGNNPHLELRQVRWHPASPTDSHLLALLSDNTIRVYDNTVLRHVWQVGPIPLKNDANLNSSFSAIMALGETAVDFDIAPAVKVTDTSAHTVNDAVNANSTTLSVQKQLKNVTNALNESSISMKSTQQKTDKIEWPIIVLRNNGNIYVLMTGFDTDKPRLQGPITITPPTADNYGLESCSLLVIPSLPPTLVVAESNGKLHHALLLEAENAEDSFNEIDSTINIYPSEWTVHVLETVELELGLPKQDAGDSVYNCPIYLKRDFINELRYFAYHNTGLHVITVNFIGELQRFLQSEVSSDITSLSNPSRAEYILCTQIDTSDRVNAVLGFVLLQMPSGIVLLLSSGQVISLKLVIDPTLLFESATAGKQSVAARNHKQPEMNELLDPSFVDHIKNLLQRSVTQPILSLDKSTTPTPQVCYELLTQAMEVLRSQYMKRHELVRAEFTKRINTIRLLKEQQYKDIEYLQSERENIREQAHKLAERFEEINDQQELLAKRCQDLMRQANTCLPGNTLADKEFAQEADRINKASKDMAQKLQKARDTMNKQWYHISKYQETAKKTKVVELPEKQERIIKEVIMQMNAEIDGQIREVKRLNKVVGI